MFSDTLLRTVALVNKAWRLTTGRVIAADNTISNHAGFNE